MKGHIDSTLREILTEKIDTAIGHAEALITYGNPLNRYPEDHSGAEGIISRVTSDVTPSKAYRKSGISISSGVKFRTSKTEGRLSARTEHNDSW